MELIHDALEAQLRDLHGRKIGRVDSIVVVLDADGPPRVVAIECGPVVLASRVHPRIGHALAGWLRRRGSVLAAPFRIEWTRLRWVDNDVVVEGVDAETAPVLGGERWTRDRVIGRVPGA